MAMLIFSARTRYTEKKKFMIQNVFPNKIKMFQVLPASAAQCPYSLQMRYFNTDKLAQLCTLKCPFS